MMYKANCDAIEGYKVGDVVPNVLAERLIKVYKYSPVDVVEGEVVVPKEEVVVESKSSKKRGKKKSSSDSFNIEPWVDDYLNRSRFSVCYAISKDNFSRSQLAQLFSLEIQCKKRGSVLKALKKKLEEDY